MAHAGLAAALLMLYGLYMMLALPPALDSLAFQHLLRWLVSFFFFLVLFERLNASGGRLPQREWRPIF